MESLSGSRAWIEVLVGCRAGESAAVQSWLEGFPQLPLNDAIASETVRLRQQHGLKVPDAILLATARCAADACHPRQPRFSADAGGCAAFLCALRLRCPARFRCRSAGGEGAACRRLRTCRGARERRWLQRRGLSALCSAPRHRPVVVHHPPRQALPIDFPAGDGHHHSLSGFDACGELKTVEHQGDLQRGMSDALVPVHKGVVLDEGEAECGRFGDQAGREDRTFAQFRN